MITRKRVKRNHKPSTHVPTRRFKVHKHWTLLIFITYFALTLCADVAIRPHKPWPGWVRPKPPPGYESDVTLDDSAGNHSIIEFPITEPMVATSTTVDMIEADDEDLDNEDDVNEEYSHPTDPIDTEHEKSELHKTPEEELNEMIEGLGNLLSNESAVVTMDNVSDAFDQMDDLLEAEDETLEFPGTVLTALDALGARADLNGSAFMTTTRRNVAVAMADSAPGRPVRGLRIAAAEDGFTDDTIQILQDEVDTTILTSADTDAVVNLPASLAEMSRRISFVVFRSDRIFVRHGREHVVNSKVISVSVENFTQLEQGEVIDIHFKPTIYEKTRNLSRACAYWHFADNGTGYWSQEGCTFISSPTGLLDTCRCTHLTHFAEILVPKAVFSEDNETALKIVSLTGCFLSLFGLIIIGITAIVFRSWRNDFNNKIWLQLTIALLINVTSFLIIVFSEFEDYSMVCMIVGVILHYAVLASFCWMLVAAVISYRKLVLIFARDPKRRLLKASAFSWLFPLVIVGTLLAVAPQSYTKRFEEKTPAAGFCYPSGLGLWLSVFLPIAIVVMSNWILFALIIRSVFGTKKIQKHGDSSEMFRRASVSCLLVFLFGLPWIFGLFAYNIVAAYFFTLTTSYQGFILFIFFVIINTKTRGMWLSKLRVKKKTNAHASSSMVTSRNAVISNEAEQSPFLEHSSTKTNVTSLVSNSSDEKAVAYNTTSSLAVIEDSHYNSKDSDIDSFKTAQSHDHFSEDEIFKSIEGITDVIANVEEMNTMPTEAISNSNINLRHSMYENKILTLDKDIIENNSPAAKDISMGTSVEKLRHDDDSNSSNKDDASGNASQIADNGDDSVRPAINIYSVTTQSASLIS